MERGFSLIELLVGMGITLLILSFLTRFFLQQHHDAAVLEARVEMWQSLSMGMDFLEREIRVTGYGQPADISPISMMESNELHLQGDWDDNGTATSLAYRWNAARRQLQRRMDPGNWAPLIEQVIGLTFSYQQEDGGTTTESRDVRSVHVFITVRSFRPDPLWPENGGYRTSSMERRIPLKNAAIPREGP